MTESPLYPIRDVARLTGVNPVTLRAWQRRYGLVVPRRTEKGHRLYSEQDIALIRRILAWLELGVSIGQVSSLLEQEPPTAGAQPDHWQEKLESLDSALLALNQRQLESRLGELTANYPLPLLRRQVFNPWLERLARHLERPDGAALHAYALNFLETYFGRRLIAQDKGQPLTLAGVGRLPPLELALCAMEAREAGFMVTLLPQLTAREARLIAPRLDGPLLVLVGAGVSGEVSDTWPEGCVQLGEMLSLYPDYTGGAFPGIGEWLAAREEA
ncbi:MerR family transcriptional regulator [Aeromonas diversa CDC 2478-85]|uniref:MerR family transcriptional regulator n=1 Tax=Aeromonas diversa CDC 2478-85 TaxID=1268237 RepID=N9VIS4_9GAMM|nr:MerR family transcriptional regulator [Aeromonas diversa]ENY71523.1 MerR family transcriptional regulator [Aeromonas diversa CDC 2478-85]